MSRRSLLLVAGPSGSGKSRLARLGGVVALPLDEFYFDHDHPHLPRSPFGITDWDDVRSWDLGLAVATLRALVEDGVAEVPRYDISRSERVGSWTLDCADATVILAEGVFAPETLPAARQAGVPTRAIWLDRPRATNFSRRLARDLKEKRKPPTVLLRRGAALFRDEPRMRKAALEAGFEAMSMRHALRLVRRLAGSNASPG
ncbi:MAG: uridine kinase [Propionibacterium sp.]|nr:uridine kinase [Propionibacterium sp.]